MRNLKICVRLGHQLPLLVVPFVFIVEVTTTILWQIRLILKITFQSITTYNRIMLRRMLY